MNPQYLISMVNDISNFYVSQGELPEAAAQVESHLARYWEKRMRHQIIAHLHSGGDGTQRDIARCRSIAGARG